MTAQTIWKYPLELTDEQKISMPSRSTFLCTQMQGDTVTLWAQADPNSQTISRKIFIVGTGNPVPASADLYIGTVQLRGQYEGLVFHVYAGAQP